MDNNVFSSVITIYSIFKALIAIWSEGIGMTIESSQKALEVKLPEGTPAVVTQGNLCVAFSATGASLTINGQAYAVNETGLILPTNVANDQPAKDLAERVLEVGLRLRDGTVVLSVDLDKNQALFVPAKIFGGRSTFDNQNDVVKSVNRDALHGHKDWRRITEGEGKTLADNWAKVTTQAPEWFWLASSDYFFNGGRVRCGGISDWNSYGRNYSYPVPVVRSGPAQNLDI